MGFSHGEHVERYRLEGSGVELAVLCSIYESADQIVNKLVDNPVARARLPFRHGYEKAPEPPIVRILLVLPMPHQHYAARWDRDGWGLDEQSRRTQCPH